MFAVAADLLAGRFDNEDARVAAVRRQPARSADVHRGDDAHRGGRARGGVRPGAGGIARRSDDGAQGRLILVARDVARPCQGATGAGLKPRYNRSVLRPYRGQLPRVHASAFVDESAQVIGDVEIGEESSVWMCAVVRGDVHWIRIGRRTNIQDGTIVHVMNGTHPTRIGDDVTIGHAAVVHGCTIEDRCLIGMGAILLNGAHIGAQSIVAAGAIVTEEMKIPPRSLVMGQPAKVKRLLTEAEVAGIQTYADRYVQYRLDYQ
jgi:carbonic anhydrase/acetyltransferase-like protein (isoleucine patch superfamily)